VVALTESVVAARLVAELADVAEPPLPPLLPTPLGVPPPPPPEEPPVPPEAWAVADAAPLRDVTAEAVAPPAAAPAPPLPPGPAPLPAPEPPLPPVPPAAVAELLASPGVAVAAEPAWPTDPLPPEAPGVAPPAPLVPDVPVTLTVLIVGRPDCLRFGAPPARHTFKASQNDLAHQNAIMTVQMPSDPTAPKSDRDMYSIESGLPELPDAHCPPLPSRWQVETPIGRIQVVRSAWCGSVHRNLGAADQQAVWPTRADPGNRCSRTPGSLSPGLLCCSTTQSKARAHR